MQAPEQPERVGLGTWLGVTAAYLVVPLILVGAGRDVDWWQAWVFSLVVLVAGLGGRMWAEHRHPGLQADRMKVGRGQAVKAWDRILAPLMGFSILYLPVIVAALDHRWGWSTPYPVSATALGIALCVVGYGFAVWAIAENRFFTFNVRIQTERGHEVCDTGPYRLVRHPGYAGNVLAMVGLTLALSSTWAGVACVAALVVAVLRTALEDRALQEELRGYRGYAERVRYRLIPGVW